MHNWRLHIFVRQWCLYIFISCYVSMESTKISIFKKLQLLNLGHVLDPTSTALSALKELDCLKVIMLLFTKSISKNNSLKNSCYMCTFSTEFSTVSSMRIHICLHRSELVRRSLQIHYERQSGNWLSTPEFSFGTFWSKSISYCYKSKARTNNCGSGI